MKKPSYNKMYLLMSFIMLFAGVVFYGFYNEIIIVRMPSKKGTFHLQEGSSIRKNIRFYYWHNDSIVTEEKQIIYSTNPQVALFNIITSWLSLADEEGLLKKKISLQSVMLDQTAKDAYISFDRSVFLKTSSTHSKLMIIHSLLKTVEEAGLSLKSVQFLVHFKPMTDPHLDFSHPWPFSGYLRN